MSSALDLGSGFTARYYVGQVSESAAPPRDVWEAYDRGLECGITLWRGEDVIGQAPFVSTRGGPTWAVQCRDPLTISPSLLCQPAGVHGFIREGKWVPA